MAQRIYLIEDDPALRTELAHVLELSGYAVAAYEGTWGDTAARALAAELKDTPIDVFVSSDLKRAFDTCVILAAAHGVSPDAIVQTKLLRERDWGSFTGRYIPDLKDARWTDDIESLDALGARAAAFLQFVRDNYEGKTVLAVGHGITNKAIRSVHSGTPMNETPRMANAEVVTMQL